MCVTGPGFGLEPGSACLVRMAPGGHHKLSGRYESSRWCDARPPESSFSSRDGARRASKTAGTCPRVMMEQNYSLVLRRTGV